MKLTLTASNLNHYAKPATSTLLPGLLISLLFCSLFATGLLAQEDPVSQRDAAIQQARDFLAMDDAGAREFAQKLSPEEAKALTTQILNLKRNSNPELDRLLVLVQHLDNIRASELAQARLDKLLLVLSLVLTLFSIYLLFLLLDQKQTLRKMQQLIANSKAGDSENQKQADTQIYRG